MKKRNYNTQRTAFLLALYGVVLIFLCKYLSIENYCSYERTVKEIVLGEYSYPSSAVEKQSGIISLGLIEGDAKSTYSVEGWGIEQKFGKWYPGVIKIVLYSEQTAYEIKAFPVGLNDIPMPSEICQVYDKFKAGFIARFPANTIKPGWYTVGVLFDDGEIVWTGESLEIKSELV